MRISGQVSQNAATEAIFSCFYMHACAGKRGQLLLVTVHKLVNCSVCFNSRTYSHLCFCHFSPFLLWRVGTNCHLTMTESTSKKLPDLLRFLLLPLDEDLITF